MKKRVLLTGPVVKILAAFAVVLGFVLIVYSKSGFPAPRESDRISAFDGSFSIIKPRDLDSRVVQASPDKSIAGAIEISSSKALGLGEQLAIERLREAPDIEKLKSNGFKAQPFQGREAWVVGKVTKKINDYVVTMLFQGQDENWYKMELRLGRQEELRDCDWWPFITSFKSRPKASGPASLSWTNAVDRGD